MDNYVVFDIGGSSVKWSVINEKAEFLKSDSFKTPDNKDTFFKSMSDISNNMKKEFDVKGIAISASGAVDPITGIIGGLSAVPYIHGPNFKEILKESTGLDIAIENDANCAALGECWVGAGKDNNDLAFIVCGSGIGGAIVKDKKVHSGIHKHGGEFGYCSLNLNFNDDGVPCCETWSGIGSTVHMADKVAKLKGLKEGKLNGITVFNLCEDGDEIAMKEVNKYYYTMAVGIYNIQYVFDPEVIILGGAISDRKDYLDQINKRLDYLMDKGILVGKIKPQIKRCEYGNNANKLGALYNFIQRNK